jgi:hypothetical protein
MSDAKIDMLQIDHGLSEIQVIIYEIADGIYMQNAIRSRQLKSQILNIGCVRGQLECIAKTLEAQPETAGRTLGGVAPTTAAGAPCECCEAAFILNTGFNFCPTCGRRIK